MTYNYKKTVRFTDDEYFNRYKTIKPTDYSPYNRYKSDYTIRRLPSLHDLISSSDESFKRFANSTTSDNYTYKSDYLLRRRVPSLHNLLSDETSSTVETVHYKPQANKTKIAQVQTDDSFLRDTFYKSQVDLEPPSQIVYKTEILVPSTVKYVAQPRILYERKYEYKYHYSENII